MYIRAAVLRFSTGWRRRRRRGNAHTNALRLRYRIPFGLAPTVFKRRWPTAAVGLYSTHTHTPARTRTSHAVAGVPVLLASRLTLSLMRAFPRTAVLHTAVPRRKLVPTSPATDRPPPPPPPPSHVLDRSFTPGGRGKYRTTICSETYFV